MLLSIEPEANTRGVVCHFTVTKATRHLIFVSLSHIFHGSDICQTLAYSRNKEINLLGLPYFILPFERYLSNHGMKCPCT